MNLYLIRHGDSNDFAPTGKDTDRELSETGKIEFEKMVRTTMNALEEIDIILTSPLIRARQTAEILKSQLNKEINLEICSELSPGLNYKFLCAICELNNNKTNIAIVGHQPDLSDLIFDYCNLDYFQFKKGGIVKISFKNMPKLKSGVFEFYIYPKMLK